MKLNQSDACSRCWSTCALKADYRFGWGLGFQHRTLPLLEVLVPCYGLWKFSLKSITSFTCCFSMGWILWMWLRKFLPENIQYGVGLIFWTHNINMISHQIWYDFAQNFFAPLLRFRIKISYDFANKYNTILHQFLFATLLRFRTKSSYKFAASSVSEKAPYMD